jgi:hypothetical protein
VSEFKGKRGKLGQMLIDAGAIEPAQLTAALEEQKSSGGLLGMAMVRLGFVDERTLVRALAGQLKLPVIQLKGKRIDSEVLDLARATRGSCISAWKTPPIRTSWPRSAHSSV